MAGYNKRKLQILRYVQRNKDAVPADISQGLSIEIHNSRTLLKRYQGQGLVSRVGKDELGANKYRLTEKGRNRIKWLKNKV